jgi:hypothetical protein
MGWFELELYELLMGKRSFRTSVAVDPPLSDARAGVGEMDTRAATTAAPSPAPALMKKRKTETSEPAVRGRMMPS